MKLTHDMMERIRAFVELNGLYPQPCGATLTELCKTCMICWDTFKEWEKKPEFSEMLKSAREKFAETTEITLVNSLVRAATGQDFVREKQEATAQVVKEYDPKTGKKIKEYTTKEVVPKKMTKETIFVPPSVDAAKFLLTNMSPDRWKLKHETAINTGGQTIALQLTPKATQGLELALSTGAQPRKPLNE